MQKQIKDWLSGNREFFTGVLLYKKLPKRNARLLELLNAGPSTLARSQLVNALQGALLEIDTNKPAQKAKTGVVVRNVVLKDTGKPAVIASVAAPVNAPLYLAAKTEADNGYKAVMNLRAELFALARHDLITDVNLPDRIEARRKMSLDIVKAFKHVSELYDRADYVRIHGRVPDLPDPGPDDSITNIPDHLVKQTLDNLRKNLSKTRRKPVTAERTVKLQLWEQQIKILEERWRLLKS